MDALARRDWTVWSCDASVVVADGGDVDAAESIVRDVVADVDRACSRFRADSELALLGDGLRRGVEVSSVLGALIRGALDAAAWTDGDVDPTLGNDLVAIGYSTDIAGLGSADGLAGALQHPGPEKRSPRWSAVTLDGSTLTVPRGIRLDLGATAKAIAADWAAARIFEQSGCGALVSLGGDIATAGDDAAEGWEILVQDRVQDPSQQITLRSGAAIATSSTQKRRWASGGYVRHHILDPRFGLPVESPWRSVTVASSTCLHANALTTAAIVRGFPAVQWLDDLDVSARFVDLDGRVVTSGAWPMPAVDLVAPGGAR